MNTKSTGARAIVNALCTACLFFAGARAGATDPQIAGVIAAIEEAQRNLTAQGSMFVAYTQTRTSPEGDVVTAQYENAWKNNWLLVHDLGRSDSDRGETIGIWRDGFAFDRESHTSQVSTELRSTYFDKLFYFYTTGLDLIPHIQKEQVGLGQLMEGLKKALPFEAYEPSLVKNLRGHEDFQVRPQQETIDGFQCIVLERPGKEVIWLDRARPACCRKRQYYQSSGVLISEISNRDFKEVTAGVWLPNVQDTQRYHWAAGPAELRGKLNYTERNVISELKIGNVEDSRFDIPPTKKGEIVIDHVRDVTYTVHPPGTKASEAIEAAVAEAAERLGKANRAYQMRNSEGQRRLMVLLNASVILAIVAIIQAKRLRSRWAGEHP